MTIRWSGAGKRGKANLGRGLEDLLILTNKQYKAQNVAVIHKVPTAWLPIRGEGGFKGCKLDDQAESAVDFVGACRLNTDPLGKLSTTLPIALEAKHTSKGLVRWDEVSEAERDFLDHFRVIGGLAYVLVSFNMAEYYVIPWSWWRERLERWEKAGRGKGASLNIKEAPPEFQVKKGRVLVDYLKTIEEQLKGGQG